MNYIKYFDIIKEIPKPTIRQTEYFIERFTYAHSWYKHIDRENPEQFVFYIDPNPNLIKSTGDSWNYLPIRYTQNLELIGAKPNTEDGKIKRIYIQSNNDLIEMPEELINFSSIGLTGCIHRGFKDMLDTKLLSGGELTCRESHIREVEALRKHLSKIVGKIYSK